MAFYGRWAPYVPVAQRRAQAERKAKNLVKKGQTLRPIRIMQRKIATSFWGESWCKNLESYSDWANRLPRGRAYARNGSIVDLQIEKGQVTALVSGSSLYRIQITIDKLDSKKWQVIRSDCATQVRSVLDLLRGKLPSEVLERLSKIKDGLFPHPKEIRMQCSCPDYATMCKHVAATLYGVGHLLDSEPQLFFVMRGVDQADLVAEVIGSQQVDDVLGLGQDTSLAGEDLGAIFGIDLSAAPVQPQSVVADKPAKPGRHDAPAQGKAKTVAKKSAKKATPSRSNSKSKPAVASARKSASETPAKSAVRKGTVKQKLTSKKGATKSVKKATQKNPASKTRSAKKSNAAKKGAKIDVATVSTRKPVKATLRKKTGKKSAPKKIAVAKSK